MLLYWCQHVYLEGLVVAYNPSAHTHAGERQRPTQLGEARAHLVHHRPARGVAELGVWDKVEWRVANQPSRPIVGLGRRESRGVATDVVLRAFLGGPVQHRLERGGRAVLVGENAEILPRGAGLLRNTLRGGLTVAALLRNSCEQLLGMRRGRWLTEVGLAREVQRLPALDHASCPIIGLCSLARGGEGAEHVARSLPSEVHGEGLGAALAVSRADDAHVLALTVVRPVAHAVVRPVVLQARRLTIPLTPLLLVPHLALHRGMLLLALALHHGVTQREQRQG
ncbi:hypothetical protein T492DRAFT_1048321 [Pavlovales sp. CCMP2436]|nr:hypothetical protein T492DRAFT_1048321 [Pavlovales sp. CCMP2436]|mmetsp:Transcript_43154/g.106567  ORF Transcript_43154/g.106567 Transcript_43154/m.106567 type:complete len:282 (+) Transcript_43154:113-958(+)